MFECLGPYGHLRKSASPKTHPSKPPTRATRHKQKQKLLANFPKVVLQKLHCNIRSTAVQMSFNQNLFCNKQNTALEDWQSCFAGKWRFPAAFLRISGSHSHQNPFSKPNPNVSIVRCANTQPFCVTSWGFSGDFRQFAWAHFRQFQANLGNFG